jgi:GDP-L-fucose synthase
MTIKHKVIVTGANGMLGSAICDELSSLANVKIIKLTRDVCDLLNAEAVEQFFSFHKPNFVYHCAAKVGGISANKNYPVEFLMHNVQIQNNVLSASHKESVERLIFFASNAVYPKDISRPIEEIDMLSGAPEETVRPYAIAKLAGIELCHSYNTQYGTKFLSLIPVNLYGPKDNFHPENSHVLPALLRKFHLAKMNNDKSVDVWGTGNQRREFMCSLDLARIAVEVMNFTTEKFEGVCQEYPPLINVGVGADISIRELAETIAKRVGFKGDVIFDSSKPEGINKKQTSVKKMHSLGLQHNISFDDGIGIIYDYYKEHVYNVEN